MSEIMKKAMYSATTKSDGGGDGDIMISQKELVSWVRKHNEALLQDGNTIGVIELYNATTGKLSTTALKMGLAAYAAEYVRARQPPVVYRDPTTGISVTEDAYKLPKTVKTKTRKTDMYVPKQGRAGADGSTVVGDYDGTYLDKVTLSDDVAKERFGEGYSAGNYPNFRAEANRTVPTG